MSLDSYLAALRDSTSMPAPIVERAVSERSYAITTLDTVDELGQIERTVEEMERFAEEQSAGTLAGRSVLTLGGLVNVRQGARLLVAADAVETTGGLYALRAGFSEQSLADAILSDPDIEEMITAIRKAAAYEPTAAGSVPAAPVDLSALEKDLQANVDAILLAGDSAVKDLAGVVGWGAVAGSVGGALSSAVQRSAALQAAKEVVGRIKRLALRMVEAGFRALQKAIGDGPLGQFIDKAKAQLSEWLDHGGIGDLLGRLLNADTVAPACLDAVRAAGATDTQQAAARNAGKHVAEHAQQLARVSDKVTDVVSWFGGGLWSGPIGAYLAAGFVVAIAAAAWQVQDHLDTTEPFGLPDVTEGMISSVRAAVTGTA